MNIRLRLRTLECGFEARARRCEVPAVATARNVRLVKSVNLDGIPTTRAWGHVAERQGPVPVSRPAVPRSAKARRSWIHTERRSSGSSSPMLNSSEARRSR